MAQGSILAMAQDSNLFNIFINDLHGGVECIFRKLADDKLGGAVDYLKGWRSIVEGSR